MNLTTLATDNITELLVKIIKFTRIRQKILMLNINNIHDPGFVPQDLEVDEFSELMDNAVNEYNFNQRLLFCDTENIKFGTGGALEAEPIVDEYAFELFEESPDEYLELQVDKLLENSLNQRIAAELLKQRQGEFAVF